MPRLIRQLNVLVQDAFEACGFERRFGVVVPSGRPDLCQFQCNGAMPAAKAAGQKPQAVAEAVRERLRDVRPPSGPNPSAGASAMSARGVGGAKAFKNVELAGPGFINLTCEDAWLAELARAAAADPRLGVAFADEGVLVLDFGGPNVAKPLHVGHLRSAIIGDCLQRMHRFLGSRVVSDIHLGDWGTQMGMLIEAVREEQPGLPYFEPAPPLPKGGYPALAVGALFPVSSPVSLQDLERLYPAMSARCKDDPALAEKARAATRELQAGRPGYRALWRHFVDVSAAAVKADFALLGVSWDLWLGESDSQAAIPAMLEDLQRRGVSVLSEGATVIPLDPIANTPSPPLLLVKSDGGYLYGTTDLATLRDRVSTLGAGRLLYVADRRQGLHFAQVFQGAAKAGYLDGARAEHVAFGTVNGKDGKPYKTREGGVMRLGTLLAEALEKAYQRLDENGMGKELPEGERAGVARQVALAAIKFADLCNPRVGDYVFDLEKFMLFEGRTGPYLLYAAVRMKSILRKAAERGFRPGELGEPTGAERDLYLKLLGLPETLERAAAESAPNLLCDWAYDLAGLFSGFYQGSNILREEDAARRGAWLGLTQFALQALERVLALLGLEIPEKM